MSPQFLLPSSDPVLLEKAARVADELAREYIRGGMVGIVFLGAVARGYFDLSADIDIALFKEQGSGISIPAQFLKVEGLEVHLHLSAYESELAESWDMPKRWTFSQARIRYDPQGRIAGLLSEKVPLKASEKKWLLMSGLSLSEWYANRLTGLWVQRGDPLSAQYMFFQGLNYFFDLLFSLNDELVPDMKWRLYCAQQLKRLPAHFQERLQEILLLHAISLEELERRRTAFMQMWQELLPVVEREVGKSYEEIVELV